MNRKLPVCANAITTSNNIVEIIKYTTAIEEETEAINKKPVIEDKIQASTIKLLSHEQYSESRKIHIEKSNNTTTLKILNNGNTTPLVRTRGINLSADVIDIIDNNKLHRRN
jgi:hypothetical protein